MTEYDYWKIFPRMPQKVTLGDITVRDGFQHLEKFISTRAKIFYAEEMIFAGCRNIEVTNLGNPYLMPQFSDAEEVLAHLRSDRFKARCHKRGVNTDDLTITAVTIREPSVDRAALVMDARLRNYIQGSEIAFSTLKASGVILELIYLDASDDVLIRRFSQTRRRHPLSGDNLRLGLQEERKLLSPLRAHASDCIDTSELTVHELKKLIQDRYRVGGTQC